jgi:hypothetical protein
MKTLQGSKLRSLRAVKAFLDANADRLSDVVKTGAYEDLENAIAQLSSHVSAQSGSFIEAKGSTQRHRALRKALLRDHMAKIVGIAAASLPAAPGIEPIRMPQGRPTAERLAQLAYGMGAAAGKYASTFTAKGLSEDFVQRLNAAADAMLAALDDRTASRGQRSGATAGLREKLIQGRRIVRMLDAFIQSTLQNDPALLADWNVVKRVQLTPSRSAPDDAPASTAPALALPAPATSPAQLANPSTGTEASA